MRVLFIEKQIDYEPHGIMQLSACLKQAGHETHLAIAAQEDPIKLAREIEPDIVGYSVMTGSHQYYFDLNRQVKSALKDKAPFAVFGGPHPTFFPEMISEVGVDGLCVGEGDEAFVDLANAMGNGGIRPDMPNWWLKIEDEIVRNPASAMKVRQPAESFSVMSSGSLLIVKPSVRAPAIVVPLRLMRSARPDLDITHLTN